MMMKRLCRLAPLLLIGCAVFLGPAAAADGTAAVEAWLDDAGALWSLTPETFLNQERAPLFNWLAKDKSAEARYPGYRNSPKLAFLNQPVVEGYARFANGTLASLYLSLYNRGDSGGTSEPEFARQVANLDQAITQWSGDTRSEARARKLAGNTSTRKSWVKGPHAVTLTWSASGRGKRDFRAEYIQVDITRFDPKADARKTTGAPPAAKASDTTTAELAGHVTRQDDGAVAIDGLPMVDQGQKGYCAAATAERILRYYGVNVTQHVIAQLTGTDAGQGTNPEQMLKMLRRAGTKFGIKVRTLYAGLETVADLQNMVNRYNKFAKKAKARKIVLPTAGVIDLSDIFSGLEPDAYHAYRCEGEKTDYRRFLADVKSHIDRGIPLVWSVYLGLVKEENLAQVSGGHMRIIIGYNSSTHEILYTDSWGAGHELKTMPDGDAWTITLGLYSLDPRRATSPGAGR
jgi:hypothetical protein